MVPVELVGGVIGVLAFAARRDQLDDLAVARCGARVDGVDLLRLAPGVVGQHDVDAAVDRVGLDVLGPVHRRGAEQVGGAPGLDQHVRLVLKPFSAVSGPWPKTSGSPGSRRSSNLAT